MADPKVDSAKKKQISFALQVPSTPSLANIKIQARLCGMPKAGMIYIYIPAGFAGKPVWCFTVCPTRIIPEGFALSKVGMTLRERWTFGAQGPEVARDAEGKIIYDIWDWIGEQCYPNPTDWFMEVYLQGMHQLVQRTLDFSLLTEESNYYAVHARAYIIPPTINWQQRKPGWWPTCPQEIKQHVNPTKKFKIETADTCFSLLFNDVIHGIPTGQNGEVKRLLAAFDDYTAFEPVTTIVEHEPAVFFEMPIGRIATFLVYEDKASNTHVSALEALEALDTKLQRVSIVSL